MTLTKAISLKVIIISFFLFSSSTLTAQVFDFLNGKNSVDIPFEFSHNFLLVEVKFQNVVPLTMMFDTGAEHTVLFDKVFTDLFNVPYDRKIKIFGSDLSQELYANVARNVYLNVDGLADIPRDIVVLEEDYYHLKEITGINIDGIISTSFFNNLSFKIDFKRNIITLYNPQVFKAPSNFDVADADYIKRKPYINTSTTLDNGSTLDLRLLLDTGAALPLLLHANTHPELVVPENVIMGKLGVGLGGVIEGFMGRISSLEFSEFKFTEIVSSFQDLSKSKLDSTTIVRNGLIGNQILSRFTLLFDPINEKVYFKPRKKLNKPFKYDRSGLIIYAFGQNLKDYIVQSIIPNSPAEEAGIQVGDKIKKVGILPVGFLSLGELLQKFQRKEGKKIRLKIQRGDEIITKTLILRNLF